MYPIVFHFLHTIEVNGAHQPVNYPFKSSLPSAKVRSFNNNSRYNSFKIERVDQTIFIFHFQFSDFIHKIPLRLPLRSHFVYLEQKYESQQHKSEYCRKHIYDTGLHATRASISLQARASILGTHTYTQAIFMSPTTSHNFLREDS